MEEREASSIMSEYHESGMAVANTVRMEEGMFSRRSALSSLEVS